VDADTVADQQVRVAVMSFEAGAHLAVGAVVAGLWI